MAEAIGRIVLRCDQPDWLEQHYGPIARVTVKTLSKMHWAGTGPRVRRAAVVSPRPTVSGWFCGRKRYAPLRLVV